MATAIPKACLASSAIRCRDVETGPNLGVLAVFPSTGATCRCPLPPRGLVGSIPRFGGTMRHSDASPSIPPRFVAFARRYHPSTCGFAPSDARCCGHGLGLGEPVPAPRRSLRWRRRGLPGPGKPIRTHATRSDPGEVAASTASEMRRDSLRPTHDVGPHKQCISGLNHAAYGLPVNASRPGSPQAHASLGSGWRPTLAGWDWIPTGFRTRFQRSHHGILSPLTGLSRHTRRCRTRDARSELHALSALGTRISVSSLQAGRRRVAVGAGGR